MNAEPMMAPITFTPGTVGPRPAEVLDFVARCNADAHTSDAGVELPDRERRRAPRFGLAVAVPAVVIDADYAPVGQPFMLVTRNVSTRGISLVHSHDLTGQRLAIELSGARGEKIQIALEVVRCTPFGDYWEFGCRYLRKLSTAGSGSY